VKYTLQFITMTAIEFQYNLINLQENLMRFAFSLTADKDDAKDLLQETCLKALNYCNKFVYNSSFKAWTYTIMKNTYINSYRRNIRQNTHRDQTNESFFINQTICSGSDEPDSIYSSKEIEKIIEALDDDFRLPFKMHYEGYKYIEIAEILHMKLGTVKSRIFFTRKKLMKQLNA
jgi:RNA polymerase sigma-70 factor, ECF subfamily